MAARNEKSSSHQFSSQGATGNNDPSTHKDLKNNIRTQPQHNSSSQGNHNNSLKTTLANTFRDISNNNNACLTLQFIKDLRKHIQSPEQLKEIMKTICQIVETELRKKIELFSISTTTEHRALRRLINYEEEEEEQQQKQQNQNQYEEIISLSFNVTDPFGHPINALIKKIISVVTPPSPNTASSSSSANPIEQRSESFIVRTLYPPTYLPLSAKIMEAANRASNHPVTRNIVTCSKHSDFSVTVELEHVDGGTLDLYIEKIGEELKKFSSPTSRSAQHSQQQQQEEYLQFRTHQVQFCKAVTRQLLEYLHHQETVLKTPHRNISPSTVFLRRDGNVKVDVIGCVTKEMVTADTIEFGESFYEQLSERTNPERSIPSVSSSGSSDPPPATASGVAKHNDKQPPPVRRYRPALHWNRYNGYVSPMCAESIERRITAGHENDIWAVGALMYSIMKGIVMQPKYSQFDPYAYFTAVAASTVADQKQKSQQSGGAGAVASAGSFADPKKPSSSSASTNASHIFGYLASLHDDIYYNKVESTTYTVSTSRIVQIIAETIPSLAKTMSEGTSEIVAQPNVDHALEGYISEKSASIKINSSSRDDSSASSSRKRNDGDDDDELGKVTQVHDINIEEVVRTNLNDLIRKNEAANTSSRSSATFSLFKCFTVTSHPSRFSHYGTRFEPTSLPRGTKESRAESDREQESNYKEFARFVQYSSTQDWFDLFIDPTLAVVARDCLKVNRLDRPTSTELLAMIHAIGGLSRADYTQPTDTVAGRKELSKIKVVAPYRRTPSGSYEFLQDWDQVNDAWSTDIARLTQDYSEFALQNPAVKRKYTPKLEDNNTQQDNNTHQQQHISISSSSSQQQQSRLGQTTVATSAGISNSVTNVNSTTTGAAVAASSNTASSSSPSSPSPPPTRITVFNVPLQLPFVIHDPAVEQDESKITYPSSIENEGGSDYGSQLYREISRFTEVTDGGAVRAKAFIRQLQSLELFKTADELFLETTDFGRRYLAPNVIRSEREKIARSIQTHVRNNNNTPNNNNGDSTSRYTSELFTKMLSLIYNGDAVQNIVCTLLSESMFHLRMREAVTIAEASVLSRAKFLQYSHAFEQQRNIQNNNNNDNTSNNNNNVTLRRFHQNQQQRELAIAANRTQNEVKLTKEEAHELICLRKKIDRQRRLIIKGRLSPAMVAAGRAMCYFSGGYEKT